MSDNQLVRYRNVSWMHGEDGDQCGVQREWYRADLVDELLAAAPVPCAASPADPRFADLLADLRTVESVYQKDRVAHVYASTMEKIFDKWLYDDEPDQARATGEGARDEMPTSETRTQSGPTRRSAVGVVADAGLHDLQGEANRGSSVESVAQETEAAPVAVSLGLPEALAAFIDVYDVVFDEDDVVMLQAVLARLRGEAANDSESWYHDGCGR